jgi:hypothetical protein
MSKKVLTIEVILKKEGEEHIIEIVMNDEDDNHTETIQLEDDSDESFKKLTSALANSVTTFNKILPHKSKSLFSSKKQTEKYKIETLEAQNKLLEKGDQSSSSTSEKPVENQQECQFDFKNVDPAIADKIKGVIKPLSSDEVDKLVEEIIAKKVTDKAKQEYTKEVMKCSQYLGKGDITGLLNSKEEADFFLTKDGIITDGFAIFYYKDVSDGKIIYNNNMLTYQLLWKIANPATSTNKSEWGINLDQNTEYELAIQLMKKYGTYDETEINKKLNKGGRNKTMTKKVNKKKQTRRLY